MYSDLSISFKQHCDGDGELYNLYISYTFPQF